MYCNKEISIVVIVHASYKICHGLPEKVSNEIKVKMNSSSKVFTGLTLLTAIVSHLVAGVKEGRVAAGEDVGHRPEAPEVTLLVVHMVLLAFIDVGLNHHQGHELGAPIGVPGMELCPRAEVTELFVGCPPSNTWINC